MVGLPRPIGHGSNHSRSTFMAQFSAETLAAPFTYTGAFSPVTEFWDRETRDENPGKEPPAKTDNNGIPLLSLDFMR